MEHIIVILTSLFTLSANIAVGLLWFWMKRTEGRIQEIEHQLTSIRLNYLDRFDEVKNLINKNHLEIIQKIVKLDTCLTQHMKG